MIRTAYALISSLTSLATAQDATFRNPLKRGEGADPWMTYQDGWFYLATTTGGDVRLRRAHRLAGSPGPGAVLHLEPRPNTQFRQALAA